MQKTRTGWFVPGMAGIGVGIVIGVACVAPSVARESPRFQAEGINPQERTLDANLYMQTSAEYRAACLQTYSWATERLRSRLAALPGGTKTPAIVMDLDETVIDNSGYQSFLDREKLSFTDPTWEVWERDFPQEVRLIPGAKPFIEAAEQMGVTVIYISNRLVKNQESTIAALKHVGLNTEDIANRLLLKEQTSDKTARREIAEKKHQVLMYLGDNLRDFSEEFAAPRLAADDSPGQDKAILERHARVEKAKQHLGNDWVILPNPVYGEWQKLLGSNPRSKLRPTRMMMR